MNNPIEDIVTGIRELKQNLGVISTASSEGKPEAAVVYFSYDKDLNIYFTTRKTSRKYKNIEQNPSVAFVIYSAELAQTIQIEGIARIVTNPVDQNVHFSSLIEAATRNNSRPPIDQIDESEIMFVKVTTSWARLGKFEINRNGDMFEEVTIK